MREIVDAVKTAVPDAANRPAAPSLRCAVSAQGFGCEGVELS